MLDNMTPPQVKKVLSALDGKGLRERVCIEVSGGVNLENIRDFGMLDVNLISVGGLTYAASSIDASLQITRILK